MLKPLSPLSLPFLHTHASESPLEENTIHIQDSHPRSAGNALALRVIILTILLLAALVTNPRPLRAQDALTTPPRTTWTYFSLAEYSTDFASASTRATLIEALRGRNISSVILSLTTSDLFALDDVTAPRTEALVQFLRALSNYGMTAYVAHWEDEFTGSSIQISLETRADYVIRFNRNNSAAPFAGVVTDYEMHGANRNPSTFQAWKTFHLRLRQRLTAAGLRLVAAINNPDELIRDCAQCDAAWRSQNGISGSTPLFNGDLRYFAVQDGQAVADSFIGMYYYASSDDIVNRSEDELVEITTGVPLQLQVGISVGNNALDESLASEQEVVTTERKLGALGVGRALEGTMLWRWNDASDQDYEVRDILSPSKTPATSPTPSPSPVPSPTPVVTFSPTPSPTPTSIPTATAPSSKTSKRCRRRPSRC